MGAFLKKEFPHLTVDVALEDIFSEANIPEPMWGKALEVIKKEIETHCENENIPLGRVNMSRTLINIRMTVELEILYGLRDA